MTEIQDAYELYKVIYGRVRSGDTIKDHDYGYSDDNGDFLAYYDSQRKTAITLAIQDAKVPRSMRDSNQFRETIGQSS